MNREYASAKMREFTKELESKRESEPRPVEGEELTEEQKASIAKSR